MAPFKMLCCGLAALAALNGALAQEDEEAVERFEKDFMAEDALRQDFEPAEFVFKFAENEPEAEGPGGNLRPSLIFNNELLGALPGEGNGQNLVTLEACGVNQPHHHPRGTETSFITKGELRFGFVEENGRRVIVDDIKEGTSISIPQGLVHFAQNVGCERAQFLANFPTRDPGTLTTFENAVRLPLETLRGTIGWSDDQIQELIDQVSAQPNPSQDPECLKRCGLDGGEGEGGEGGKKRRGRRGGRD